MLGRRAADLAEAAATDPLIAWPTGRLGTRRPAAARRGRRARACALDLDRFAGQRPPCKAEGQGDRVPFVARRRVAQQVHWP